MPAGVHDEINDAAEEKARSAIPEMVRGASTAFSGMGMN